MAPDCPNDYIARINVSITCSNGLDSSDTDSYGSTGEILLTVRSGKLLPSIISEDMVLTSENLYIIPSTTIIQQGVTVTVEPGTNIQFWSDDPHDPYADSYIAELLVDGTLLVEGTAEEPVRIYPAEVMDRYPVKIGSRNDGFVSLKHADVTNALVTYNASSDDIYSNTPGIIQYAERCTFRMNYTDTLIYRELQNGHVKEEITGHGQHMTFLQAKDCIFYKNAFQYRYTLLGNFERCVFADCGLVLTPSSYTKNCLFLGNNHTLLTAVDSEGRNLVIPTTMRLGTLPPLQADLTMQWYRVETDTTYILDSTRCVENPERAAFRTIHDYLHQLGAVESVIDDEEELEWYRSTLLDDLVNGYYHDEIGTDGYLKTFNPDDLQVGSTFVRLLELPGSDWNLEELSQMVRSMHQEQNRNISFVGNVILNRVSTDFDVNHWLRVEAPEVSQYTEVPLGGNYWGTTDDRTIGLQLLDYADFPSIYGLLDYKPILETAPGNTFPFVTDVTILNKDGDEITTVANEEITVRITFNRDMDTSIPLSVQYGSSYPYRDYTIEGEYVDARTWEDGYYQRINDVIIPAETKEFFDDTVEPGVAYYYNFTVVQTDLTESVPSGKITIQALDTMAPNIYHTPVYNAKTGANLVLSATVTDNLNVTAVKLYYHTAVMNGLNSKYTAIIPAKYVTTAGLDYYIEATDGISTTARGSADNPYRITVTQAQDTSSLGDVDGNGTISPLDALMLLQAINDLLNLDTQQFERADLNGDGQLTASEALKILQYVSGAIGSLNG